MYALFEYQNINIILYLRYELRMSIKLVIYLHCGVIVLPLNIDRNSTIYSYSKIT